jgi:DnaK suppressor protein
LLNAKPATEGDEVSRLDLSNFRRLLEAKQSDLLLRSFNRDEIAIESAADEIDRLQQQLSRDIAVGNLDRTSKLLRSVQAALNRIEDEEYGVCLRCEEPIAEKRLKAIPWAPYCVACQEIIERDSTLREDAEGTIGFAA